MSLFSTQSDTNKRLAVQKKNCVIVFTKRLTAQTTRWLHGQSISSNKDIFSCWSMNTILIVFLRKCDSTHVLITIATSSPGKKHESLRKWCSVNDWRMSVGVSVFLIAIGFPLRRSKLLLLRLQTLPAPRHSLHCEPLSVVERVDKMR